MGYSCRVMANVCFSVAQKPINRENYRNMSLGVTSFTKQGTMICLWVNSFLFIGASDLSLDPHSPFCSLLHHWSTCLFAKCSRSELLSSAAKEKGVIIVLFMSKFVFIYKISKISFTDLNKTPKLNIVCICSRLACRVNSNQDGCHS